MKNTLLILTLFVPIVCQAQMITFTGDHGFTYFDQSGTPITKTGRYFSLTVDGSNPLEIFGLSLEIDGIDYDLDKSMAIRYNHELPLNVGDGMPVLNASGYFNNSLGQTGFEWFLHLEFSTIESNTSYMVTNRSLENFFAFTTTDKQYFGGPFFHKVHEPSTLSIIATGLLGLFVRRKYRFIRKPISQQ